MAITEGNSTGSVDGALHIPKVDADGRVICTAGDACTCKSYTYNTRDGLLYWNKLPDDLAAVLGVSPMDAAGALAKIIALQAIRDDMVRALHQAQPEAFKDHGEA